MDAIGMDLQISDRTTDEVKASLDPPSADDESEDSNKSPSPEPTASTLYSAATDSTYYYSSDAADDTTVPVGGAEIEPERISDHVRRMNLKNSTSSTSSESTGSESRGGTSLYHPEYLAPSLTYERTTPMQLLVALIGRAFDQPDKTAASLQEQVARDPNSGAAVVKFIPFTVRRKVLCRGNFDSRELKKHNLICLCYNASEARLLLTGQDGFYSSLLRQVENLMGSNKVAFLISHYTPPQTAPPLPPSSTPPLLSPPLKMRLSHQPALAEYLERGHVISWCDHPDIGHIQRLVEIAKLEPNPQGILNACSVM